MFSARHIVRYFVDRHTVAVMAAFVFYVFLLRWCGSIGVREVQQRAAAVARHHRSILDISAFAGPTFSASVLAQSVSVAVLRLSNADVELLHGGPLDRVPSQVERQQQLLALSSRWQYYFAVGDFTLVSAPARLTSNGMLTEWITKLESVYPTCVFASLTDSMEADATGDERRLLILPTTWQSHRRALGGQQQQSLRVLLLETLPTLERLRETEAAATAAVDASGDVAKDPLFVFVSENATRRWSTAIDAAELTRPPAERWRSGKSSLDAWEEMLQTTSMPRAALRAAVAASAVPPTGEDPPVSYRRRLLAHLRREKAQAPPLTAMTDAAQYIPRLAVHLADTYGAPYVIFASWCSSVGTYGWTGTRRLEASSEEQALVLVLCLHENELVEIIPSRQHVSRHIQE
ncbi:hypothetical protein, conserved [Leishmania lindenbergi]|uniref:Membrane-associated protein n=1 Tax=Leishmania lindenbergi TaxID=651832 RepID=A0AAW3AJ44_9TRYP